MSEKKKIEELKQKINARIDTIDNNKLLIYLFNFIDALLKRYQNS